MRFFRRPIPASSAGKALAMLAAHAKREAAQTEREKVLATARMIRVEKDLPPLEVLNG